MKINGVKIIGVGGIEKLDLQFDGHMNLICGPNGVGKTTLIEIIAHLFSSGETTILKRNVNTIRSIIEGSINFGAEEKKIRIEFDTFVPEARARINGLHQLSNKLFSLKTERTFLYNPLQSVEKDTEKQEHILYLEASSGINLHEIKKWFVNRFLYSAHT